jgi:quercetin dioxygenase-like cupin family protein
MNAWDKGPFGCFGLDEGETYWQPQPTGGYVTLTMTPESFKHDHSACGFQVIPPGGRIPVQSHRAAEKVWYVLDGVGELTIDGRAHRLSPGCTAAMQRNVPHSLVNDGETDLRLFFWVTPPGYEGLLADWGRPRTEGQPAPEFDAGEVRRSPLLTGHAAETVSQEDMGHWVFVEPEAGDLYWQIPPAGGFMQWKTTTKTFASNRFFSCIQVLPPGGQIPAHAHPRNEEWLVVRTGSGTALVDGQELPLRPGSVCFVDRWVVHSMRNDGDEAMELFVVFTPPGLEDILPVVSVPRSAEYPTEPNWEQFFTNQPIPTIDVIDALFEGSVMALPHVAQKHHDETPSPVVY